jgi:hypothetical protein
MAMEWSSPWGSQDGWHPYRHVGAIHNQDLDPDVSTAVALPQFSPQQGS